MSGNSYSHTTFVWEKDGQKIEMSITIDGYEKENSRSLKSIEVIMEDEIPMNLTGYQIHAIHFHDIEKVINRLKDKNFMLNVKLNFHNLQDEHINLFRHGCIIVIGSRLYLFDMNDDFHAEMAQAIKEHIETHGEAKHPETWLQPFGKVTA